VYTGPGFSQESKDLLKQQRSIQEARTVSGRKAERERPAREAETARREAEAKATREAEAKQALAIAEVPIRVQELKNEQKNRELTSEEDRQLKQHEHELTLATRGEQAADRTLRYKEAMENYRTKLGQAGQKTPEQELLLNRDKALSDTAYSLESTKATYMDILSSADLPEDVRTKINSAVDGIDTALGDIDKDREELLVSIRDEGIMADEARTAAERDAQAADEAFTQPAESAQQANNTERAQEILDRYNSASDEDKARFANDDRYKWAVNYMKARDKRIADRARADEEADAQ
jgi:hypothetical protein